MSSNDNNTEYLKSNGVDALKETGYVARMFYDRWCYPMIITSSEGVEMFKKNALEKVKIGLMAGDSLKEQTGIYKEQMDISRRLKKAKGKPKVLSEEELHLWWLNVFALVKMRALKADDANGLLVMKMR